MTRSKSRQKSKRKPEGAGPPAGKSHLLVIEHPPGAEDLARQELTTLGKGRLRLLDTSEPAETGFVYSGTPNDLRHLRLSSALYQVFPFDIPRPKALLGHEHWQRLLGEIDALRRRQPPDTFQTFRIAAAGRFSSVFQRIKETLAADTGLQYDEDEADLQLRLRPARLVQSGWELLLRLTPRPLTSRSWRVYNYPGALNGVVAAAMIELSRPWGRERVLNLMCGSGTLLIERSLRGPAGLLAGLDLSAEALAGAQQNVSAAPLRQPVQLLQADACRTPFSAGSFHTILIDPPWGNLVGEANEPEALYPALWRESDRLATPGGQMLVITHQIKLWEQVAAQGEGWQFLASRQLFQGGLHPCIYHYRKPENS
ncbi:MAG: methyltransferase domain-containing protein [Anaerolineales bacterium]|nr:methyltransferase domain-containing protein [Anaerolineales bacterium]